MNPPATVPGLIVLALILGVFAGLAWLVLTARGVYRPAEPRTWEEDEKAAEAYCAVYCGPPFTNEGEHDPGCQEAAFGA